MCIHTFIKENKTIIHLLRGVVCDNNVHKPKTFYDVSKLQITCLETGW